MKPNALAAAAAIAFCGAAQAAGPGFLGNLDNSTVLISSAPAGSFTDLYSFTVSSDGFSAGGLFSFSGAISVSAVGLFDSSSTLLAVDSDGSDGFLTFAALPTAGLYFFGVVGNSDGGSYDGAISTVLTAAVPEPETYALMLAGLGVVGWAARRQKKA
jgi:hypothetical protein